jgi:hypothetical protein
LCPPEDQGLWFGPPAPIESTGTWLRRGFWYAEADAVVWNRMWNRDDRIYAVQSAAAELYQTWFQPPSILQAQLNTNRMLVVSGAHPGQDASIRTTLGNFLFRDSRNRDHSAELTVLGSGDWEQNRVMSSEEPFGLFVPVVIDGGNRSFDESSQQEIDYKSVYRSFELNYRVKTRLGKDQIVMDANGHWHRQANSGFGREYLAGLRYLQLDEDFNWQAQDIAQEGSTNPQPGDDGSYIIDTENDMFGLQFGLGLTYEGARWSLAMEPKGGVYVNNATGRTRLDFTADDIDDADLRLQEDALSFVGEFRILGRYHVTPSISLRAAYEMMYIEAVALAPSQATFITNISYLNTTGDPFYHGASFGFEGYW